MHIWNMPGFEYSFIKPVSKNLKCLLCMLPCRNTVLISSCGHKFCESCMDTYLRSGVFLCPEDRSSLDYAKIYPDPVTDNVIRSLPARCPNCSHGCTWTGPLGSVESHLQDCLFDMIYCPNQCSSKILRTWVSDHLLTSCPKRSLPCQHCGDIFTYDTLEHHSNHCPQELIYCEGKCGAQLQRQFLLNHGINECSKRILACPHNCGKELVFDVLSDHFQNCSKFPLKCPHSCSPLLIPRCDLILHLKTACPHTTGIYCPLREAGCQFKGSQPQLENHTKDSSDHHIKLLSRVVTKQKNHIAVLTTAIQHVQASHDGKLLWKISGFERKLEKSKVQNQTELQSPVFYTSKYGYKLQASVFLNGNRDGERTHISLYINVLTGEYDALLTWPFCLPVTFTLLDQSPDLEKRVHVKESFTPDAACCKTFHRPFKSNKSPGFGHAKFVSHETLKRRNYIREDVLFLQIVVDSGFMATFF